MNLAVLGTGMVGRSIAARLHELGHQVAMGTREPESTLARADTGGAGAQSFREWMHLHESIRLAAFADAAASAEVVFNATGGAVSLDVLAQAGEKHLDGKVLVDIANPLDFSGGVPPTLLGPWIAAAILFHTFASAVVALAALRGSRPDERPEILTATALFAAALLFRRGSQGDREVHVRK